MPVELSILRVDLRHPGVELATFIAEDLDGEGPAESKLLDPLELAGRHGALVAVNAHAFGPLPESETKGYVLGMAVQIEGYAATEGIRRSSGYVNMPDNLVFWIDAQGRPQIGPAPKEEARLGVNAWYGDLVSDGQVLPAPGGDRHPRTAVGFDAEGRWLFLVVADGRQRGTSEGMTLHELAGTMQGLGAMPFGN